MTNVSKDTKLTVLNDHYNRTVSDMKNTSQSRDRAFVMVFLLLGVMTFIVVSPDQSRSVLSQIISSQVGLDAVLSISFIGSLVWAGILFTAVRYFQAVINLEKIYNYSHRLEDELSMHYGGEVFTREGKSYLKDYPKYSEWLHLIYRYIFPVLLVAVLLVKIVSEQRTKSYPVLPLILDWLIFAMITISVALYMYSIRHAEKDEVATLSKVSKSAE